MNTAHAYVWREREETAPRSVEPALALSTGTEDSVTPEQFFTSADRTAIAWTGERRLLLAVLEDAVASFLRYRENRTTRGKRLFRETAEWFASTDHLSLCSFESICAYLNLDADYIRRGLKGLRPVGDLHTAPVSPLFPKPRRVSRHLRVAPVANESRG